MTYHKLFAATAISALMAAGAASAQTWADRDAFNEGFGETGYFDAWDQNDDAMLDQDEFGAGMFADWDTDNDNVLTEEEYTAGAERWYGADNHVAFTDYDTDTSGTIEVSEFRDSMDTEYFSGWDQDDDDLLTEDEYGTGVYDSADLDDDEYITIEEEGWFEGWFDGDDITAEVQTIGEEW